MASITRIEVANFLSEGYDSGREWSPLYRGETFRLFGQPTAIQLENGGGKTSLTESCLYLLSRDRRLKKRVDSRVAPADAGWTHIRIEFYEKPHDENILQRDLIVLTPEETPGVSYVVGLCWNRSKDPMFYVYQGTFEDAPCYRKFENKLELVDNESFRKSVERMHGSQWNRWANIQEWHEEIGQFTNIEVILQNVEFQLAGAGDYSAKVTDVKPRNGETYDAAFFRQIIAPELLRGVMGKEGDADEQKFEDTLFRSLKPAADAMVDIGRKQHELDAAIIALDRFVPVMESAKRVVEAHAEQMTEESAIAKDAAIIHTLAVKDPLPGLPVVQGRPGWAGDAKLAEVISWLVIDKQGVLITDEGLAALTNVQTSEINRRTKDAVLLGSEVIDYKHHIKTSDVAFTEIRSEENATQPFDYKHHIKKDARGGRRSAIKGYGLETALDIVSSVQTLQGSTTDSLDDILVRAFGIARSDFDTNPYRREIMRLKPELENARRQTTDAEQRQKRWQGELERILSAEREAEANQVCYEQFAARKNEFPEEFWQKPLQAREWAEKVLRQIQEDLSLYDIRVGTLKEIYEVWSDLVAKHGENGLSGALQTLNQAFTDASRRQQLSESALKDALAAEKKMAEEVQAGEICLGKLNREHERFIALAGHWPKFMEIFGDVDPEKLDPRREEQDLNKEFRAKERELGEAESTLSTMTDLLRAVSTFSEIFGAADPDTLDPLGNLDAHNEKIGIERGILADHGPGAEALLLFQDQHPNMSPKNYLETIEARRTQITADRSWATQSISNLRGEFEDLSKFSMADDRVYAKAVESLITEGVPMQRLHEVVMQSVDDKRQEQVLSLFSAALSAPVVETIEDAERATRVLEEKRYTVPVFIKSALVQFAHDGEIRMTGQVAHALMAGRRTRQVDILLNPALIEEEQDRIRGEIDALQSRIKQLDQDIRSIAPDSDGVKLALAAIDAISRGSAEKAAAAEAGLVLLEGQLEELKRRASQEAINAINAQKRYLAMGGTTAHENLGVEIARLTADRKMLSSRLDALKQQLTDEATAARMAIREYQREGGEERMQQLAAEVAELEESLRECRHKLEALRKDIPQLESAKADSVEAFNAINRAYETQRQNLVQAIEFQNVGDAAFMQAHESERQKLKSENEKSALRLQNIDFVRADAYLANSLAENRNFSDLKARAEASRNQAEKDINEWKGRISELDLEIGQLSPLAEAMHELVFEISSRRSKIATLSDLLLSGVDASAIAGHEAFEYANAIRIACLGDRPGTQDEVVQAIHNLRQVLQEININTTRLEGLRRGCNAARKNYKEKRDEYCTMARNGEINGLYEIEVDLIQDAETIEQLKSVANIKDNIQAKVDEKREDLAKILETMEAGKAAAVESLAKLARQATHNLATLNEVMRRTPNARFVIQAEVASEERIRNIIESIIAEIEDSERIVRERKSSMLNSEIEQRNANYRERIHRRIYHEVFLDPSVSFIHTAIREGEERMTPPGDRLSTGQHTALAMMWLVKQAEYAQYRAIKMYGTRREQKAALKGAQRIMFFDGLFSNLSNESYINAAFHGLKDVGDNFQLIGLIHNPYYVNNKDIFPTHLVVRRKVGKRGDKERQFMAVEEWQNDNGMITYTSAYRHGEPDAAKH